jgi:citrate lyase subunit beta/citryl-CoA lyase
MPDQELPAYLIRSPLFVPSIVPRFVERAPNAGADLICLDLEDSVPPTEKANARRAAAEALDSMPRTGYLMFVRVNGLHTGLLEEDLLAVVKPGLEGISLPKADSAATIQRVDHYLTLLERERGLETGTVKVIPWIETALAIVNAGQICTASPRLIGASFGGEDFTADMGIQRTKAGREIEWPRAQVAIICRAAGILAIDTPEADYSDPVQLEQDSLLARSLGYHGKCCIHPSQVEVINRIFWPTEEEVAQARAVVELFEKEGIEKGRAAIAHQGMMIDWPIYTRAKQLLEWAQASRVQAEE